jgi:hypothetical protein
LAVVTVGTRRKHTASKKLGSQVERWQFSAKYELGSQVGIWHIDEEKREIMSGSNVVHVVSQKPTLIVTCSTRNNPTYKKH